MTEQTMGELQALVTGAIQGALMKVSGEGGPFLIDVEAVTDEQGYLPELLVTGRESGERVRVRVEHEAPARRRAPLRPLDND